NNRSMGKTSLFFDSKNVGASDAASFFGLKNRAASDAAPFFTPPNIAASVAVPSGDSQNACATLAGTFFGSTNRTATLAASIADFVHLLTRLELPREIEGLAVQRIPDFFDERPVAHQGGEIEQHFSVVISERQP